MAPQRSRARAGSIQGFTERIETDPTHHLAGPFMPQTPLGSSTPVRSLSPALRKTNTTQPPGLWSDLRTMRWVVNPASSLKLLAIPLVLWANWEVLAPFISPSLPNPFAPFLMIQHPSPNYTPERPYYVKGILDAVFLAYNIVFFSFFRQVIAVKTARPIGKYFGVQKEAKLDRFGEQAYAVVYFAISGLWGIRIMSTLPSWWYTTKHFWIDYPHWEMSAEMKRYYLMQMAYWWQQLIVLVMGLEKPRKDYKELVCHHLLTLWLVCGSYMINLTTIGNAIFVSMDLPDTFFAFSKILNYIQYERAKVVSFGIFVVVWTYFRHYLNIKILWSLCTEWDLIPKHAQVINPWAGTWLPPWMRYQTLVAIGALQCLNLFWYYLILRVLVRTILTAETTDDRSEDEDDENTKKD